MNGSRDWALLVALASSWVGCADGALPTGSTGQLAPEPRTLVGTRSPAGRFTLEVDPRSGSVRVSSAGVASAGRGVHVPADVVQDGDPTLSPPETFQVVTTSAVIGDGMNGCPATDNCFQLRVDSFSSRDARAVTLVVDGSSPTRVMSNPDPAPPGSGLTSLFGMTTFGDIAAGGSSGLEEMRFTIPNQDFYTVQLTLYEEDPTPPPPPATCAELLSTIRIFGRSSRGVDLRARTNGTLKWIGCHGDGCAPADFQCTDDAGTETLGFGTTGTILRAVVDPSNAHGDAMPTGPVDGCAGTVANSYDNGVYDAPDANNNGFAGSVASSLCRALGYANGSVLSIGTIFCPEPHVLDADGQVWDTDDVLSNGYAQWYSCSGFR